MDAGLSMPMDAIRQDYLRSLAAQREDIARLSDSAEAETFPGLRALAHKLAGTGNGRLAFFDNGAGLTLELVERTEDIRRTPFATEAFQKLDHITVCVPADHQADTARIFVQELGFVRENDRRFRLGDDVIEMEDMAPGRGTLDNLVFHVKDAAATEALLRQNGYAPERQGNALALIGPGGEKLVFEQK